MFSTFCNLYTHVAQRSLRNPEERDITMLLSKGWGELTPDRVSGFPPIILPRDEKTRSREQVVAERAEWKDVILQQS